jgi:hypothetical protein
VWRLIITASIVGVAAIAALWARRTVADAPSRPEHWTIPAQVDRADFLGPGVEWLVAVFSSANCDVCASVVAKTKALASAHVAVQEIEYSADKPLHERYGIDAVPTTLIVDCDGVVRRNFVGPVTATDLWAAVAEARDT